MTEREGAAPCSAAESLRRGGANIEVGPDSEKTGSTLDELMLSRASSTDNLIGRDIFAGGGAAVAGVRFSGLMGGVRDAISFSSVKLHTSIHVVNTSCSRI